MNTTNNNYQQHQQQQQFIKHELNMNVSQQQQHQQSIVLNPINVMPNSFPASSVFNSTLNSQQQTYHYFIQHASTLPSPTSYNVPQLYSNSIQQFNTNIPQQTNLPPLTSVISPPLDQKPTPPWLRNQPQGCFPMSSYLTDDRYTETPAPIPIECHLGPETPSPSLPSTSPDHDAPIMDTSDFLRTFLAEPDDSLIMNNEKSPTKRHHHRRTKAQIAADRRVELERTLKKCAVIIKKIPFEENDMPTRVFVGSNNKFELRMRLPCVPKMKLVPASFEKIVNMGFMKTQKGIIFSCMTQCHFKTYDPLRFKQHLANHEVGDDYGTVSGKCGLCNLQINSGSPLYELLHMNRTVIAGQHPTNEVLYSRVRKISFSSDVSDDEEEDTEEEEGNNSKKASHVEAIPSEVDPIIAPEPTETLNRLIAVEKKVPSADDLLIGVEFNEDELGLMASAMEGLDDIFTPSLVDFSIDIRKVEEMLEKKDPDFDPNLEAETEEETIADEVVTSDEADTINTFISTTENSATTEEEMETTIVNTSLSPLRLKNLHKLQKQLRKKHKKKKSSHKSIKKHKHRRNSEDKKERSGKKRQRRLHQQTDSSEDEHLQKKTKCCDILTSENSPSYAEEVETNGPKESSRNLNDESKSDEVPLKERTIEFHHNGHNYDTLVFVQQQEKALEEPEDFHHQDLYIRRSCKEPDSLEKSEASLEISNICPEPAQISHGEPPTLITTLLRNPKEEKSEASLEISTICPELANVTDDEKPIISITALLQDLQSEGLDPCLQRETSSLNDSEAFLEKSPSACSTNEPPSIIASTLENVSQNFENFAQFSPSADPSNEKVMEAEAKTAEPPQKVCDFLLNLPLSFIKKIKQKPYLKNIRKLSVIKECQETLPLETKTIAENVNEKKSNQTLTKTVAIADISKEQLPKKDRLSREKDQFDVIVVNDDAEPQPKKKRGRKPKNNINQTARKRPGGLQPSTPNKIEKKPIENLLDQMKPCSVIVHKSTKVMIKNATKGREAFVQLENSSEELSGVEFPTTPKPIPLEKPLPSGIGTESSNSEKVDCAEASGSHNNFVEKDLLMNCSIPVVEIEYDENDMNHLPTTLPVAGVDFPSLIDVETPKKSKGDKQNMTEDDDDVLFEVIPETTENVETKESSEVSNFLKFRDDEIEIIDIVKSPEELTKIKAARLSSDLYPWIDSNLVKKWAKAEHCAKLLLEEKCLFSNYKCMSIECSYFTSDLTKFKNHIESHKDQDRYFVCSYCLVGMSNPNELSKHIEDTHAYDRYQCRQCMYRSCEKFYCDVHRQKMHSNQKVSILKSNGQLLMTSVRKAAERDLIEKLDEIVKPLNCEFCSRKFHNLEECMKHLQEESEKTQDCDRFDKINLELSKIRNMSDTLADKFALYRCLYCTDGFHEEASIQEHLSAVHPHKFSFVCMRRRHEIVVDIENPSVAKTFFISVVDLFNKKLNNQLKVVTWKGRNEDLTSSDVEAVEVTPKPLLILNAFSLSSV